MGMQAIECSGVVELNVARNSVRRRYPLPDPKTNPTWNRTVVVENLPRNASIVDIGTRFGVAGKVEHVRLIDNKKVPDDIAAYMDVIKNPHGALQRGKVCTLVEFASVGEAQTACDMLTDETNWRNGRPHPYTPIHSLCNPTHPFPHLRYAELPWITGWPNSPRVIHCTLADLTLVSVC